MISTGYWPIGLSEVPSRVYKDDPVALHLRAMNMLYEAIREKGSMVIVPSTAVETMGLGGMLGSTALKKTGSEA